MATDNVTPMEQLSESVPSVHEDPTMPYRDVLHGWMLSAQAVTGAAQAIGAETIAFWHGRTKAAMETTSRLAQCTSPQMLTEIQMDHARTAIHAYADQMAKMGEITGRLVREGFAPVTGSWSPVSDAKAADLAA